MIFFSYNSEKVKWIQEDLLINKKQAWSEQSVTLDYNLMKNNHGPLHKTAWNFNFHNNLNFKFKVVEAFFPLSKPVSFAVPVCVCADVILGDPDAWS